jgi:pimeloyl-ACP methyl ester carboxylesterase
VSRPVPPRTPRPAILLVPGWRDHHAVLDPFANWLRSLDRPPAAVATVAFEDPFGSNIQHATEIAAAVSRLERTTDAEIVVVAHSMGGLGLRWYLAHHAAERIRTAVFLATPHRGTWLAWLARGPGASEMRPSSQFLRELDARESNAREIDERELDARVASSNVRCISFRAPYDTRLLPPATAWHDRMEQRLLPAIGHKRILRQPSVFNAVLDAIEGPTWMHSRITKP